jgi:hypothetical protein
LAAEENAVSVGNPSLNMALKISTAPPTLLILVRLHEVQKGGRPFIS